MKFTWKSENVNILPKSQRQKIKSISKFAFPATNKIKKVEKYTQNWFAVD